MKDQVKIGDAKLCLTKKPMIRPKSPSKEFATQFLIPLCVNHVLTSTTQVNNKCSAKLCSASFLLHEILLGGCEWKGQNCAKGGGTFTREECSWACTRFLNSWGQSKVFAFKWAQLTCPWSSICNPNSWHLSPWSYSRTSKMNRKYSEIQLWLFM